MRVKKIRAERRGVGARAAESEAMRAPSGGASAVLMRSLRMVLGALGV